MNIGERVKLLRKEKKLTIKQMSDLIGLSTGFISQFERGITTIDVDHLKNMAQVLETDISTFFVETPEESNGGQDVITRSYDRTYLQNLNGSIHFSLTKQVFPSTLTPEYLEIMPNEKKEQPGVYGHEGEEFIFVLEGILTFYWQNKQYKLYPGDSAHYPSTHEHNWANMSNQVVKLLVVYAPLNETDN